MTSPESLLCKPLQWSLCMLKRRGARALQSWQIVPEVHTHANRGVRAGLTINQAAPSRLALPSSLSPTPTQPHLSMCTMLLGGGTAPRQASRPRSKAASCRASTSGPSQPPLPLRPRCEAKGLGEGEGPMGVGEEQVAVLDRPAMRAVVQWPVALRAGPVGCSRRLGGGSRGGGASARVVQQLLRCAPQQGARLAELGGAALAQTQGQPVQGGPAGVGAQKAWHGKQVCYWRGPLSEGLPVQGAPGTLT